MCLGPRIYFLVLGGAPGSEAELGGAIFGVGAVG